MTEAFPAVQQRKEKWNTELTSPSPLGRALNSSAPSISVCLSAAWFVALWSTEIVPGTAPHSDASQVIYETLPCCTAPTAHKPRSQEPNTVSSLPLLTSSSSSTPNSCETEPGFEQSVILQILQYLRTQTLTKQLFEAQASYFGIRKGTTAWEKDQWDKRFCHHPLASTRLRQFVPTCDAHGLFLPQGVTPQLCSVTPGLHLPLLQEQLPKNPPSTTKSSVQSRTPQITISHCSLASLPRATAQGKLEPRVVCIQWF